MSCDAYPYLDFTEVVRSNLGGFGPDGGEEGLVIKAYDGQVRRHLHVSINAGPTYKPVHREQNGLQGRCGLINIQTGTDVALRFSFRDAVTGQPAMLPQVAFTFFDLDQCEGHHCVEFISVQNVSAYRLSPKTELMVLRPTTGEKTPTATFYATTAGDWFDNPRSEDTLTMTQMNRGVSVAFDHITQFSMVFGASAGKGARYLSFMGFPGLLCIGKAATAENHFAPVVESTTTQAPSVEEHMPVHWQPSNEGNLSGTLTIDNVDWNSLKSRQHMAADFEAALKHGIAETAGVTPEEVTLAIEPGTVAISVTVRPPTVPPPRDAALRSTAFDNGSAGGASTWRARLADANLLGQAVSEKVRTFPGIQKVASGPVKLTNWHVVANTGGDEEVVTGLARLDNVSYAKLSESPALLQGVSDAISQAVATAVGGGVSPGDVDLGVFAGAVKAHVAVRPPEPGGVDQAASHTGADASAARSAGARFAGSATGVAHHGVGINTAAAAAAMFTRLQSRSVPICGAVATQVKAVPGIEEVTTGNVTAQGWQVWPVEDKGVVKGMVVIHDVDYELLLANPELMSKFQESVRRAIAATTGGGVGPEDVSVQLFAGNVVLRAMVSPGFGSRFGGRGSDIANRLSADLRGDSLCHAVTREVSQVKGIRQVANLTMKYHRVKRAGEQGLPSWRHLPSDSFEQAAEGGVVSCTADGLDYGQLLLSPVLLSRVEDAVHRAVASEAGGLLAPGDLTMSLHVGSVLAEATVRPPDSPVVAMQQRMGKHHEVDRKIWDKVQKISQIGEVAVERDRVLLHGGSSLRKALMVDTPEPSVFSSWDRLEYLGYGLIVLGALMLVCLFASSRSKTSPSGGTPSRSREVYVYLPVDNETEAPAAESEAEAALVPVEVAFRDFFNETKAVKFRYRDHGMRLTQDNPPKVASFSVNSFARDKGVEAGWTIAKIGNHEVDRRERGEAVERLLKTRLEKLPPAPLRLEFETGGGQMRTFLFDRQPLGLEFTKTAPFKVEHHKPDSLAKECGVEVGWTLRQIGTVKLSSATAFDSLLSYLREGLRDLPQDPSGPRLQVEFVDPSGKPRVVFFQRQPLGLKLRTQASGGGRRDAVVVDGFDFNSYAKDRGVHANWELTRVGEQEVSPHHDADEVVQLLLRHTAHLPLWPLRMDFVPTGSSGTRTFYFENQPLGLEFTKSPPLRVDHFKPDSLAQAVGVKESWSLARIGDVPVTKNMGIQQLMGYMQAGLEHLPQVPKGLRVDFLDASGHRRRCHFQRRPLGLVLSKLPPTCVESFPANGYAREKGVQVGWTIVRVGEQELPPSATPQEAESLLEEQSASLPLWPLRVDFDVGKGTIRTVYFDRQPLDITFTTSLPFRIESLSPGGYSTTKGVELGWAVLRVGHLVVCQEMDHETLKRSFLEGSAHLPAAGLKTGKP